MESFSLLQTIAWKKERKGNEMQEERKMKGKHWLISLTLLMKQFLMGSHWFLCMYIYVTCVHFCALMLNITE